MRIEDLNTIEIDGTLFVSALAHELKFDDGTVLKGNPGLAAVFCAEEVTDWVEQPVPNRVQYKTPRYEPSTDGKRFLQEHVLGAKGKTVIVTSIVGASAFGNGTVSPVTTVETARAPPHKKIVLKYNWHDF